MKNKGDLAPSESRRWTQVDDYVEALARRRTARRQREPIRRSQPETPRPWLSTVPFLTLIVLLGVLAVGIMIAAFPGNQPQHRQSVLAHQQGVANKGWLQEAERDMHR